MVILQEYLLENLQKFQTPLQINTFKPLTQETIVKQQPKQRSRNQRNEQRMSHGSWFSPFWHVVLWGKKTNEYGSIPIDTFLVGWTSIYQLFWGSLGTRVLTHPQMCSVNVQADPAHRQQVGELCQIIQVLRRNMAELRRFNRQNGRFPTDKMGDFNRKMGDFPASTVIDLVKRLICRWQQTSSQFADYPLGFSAMDINGIWKNPIRNPIIQSPRSYWVNLYNLYIYII